VLLLPNQSVWILAPAMGGSTQIVVSGAFYGAGPTPTTIRMSGVDEGSLASLLDPTVGPGANDHVTLGGGFYLFALVPLMASLLGGRAAAAGSLRSTDRALRGAGAGLAFSVLMGASAWFSLAALPLVVIGLPVILPTSIRATMPSTAVLALVWGTVGGALGALSSPWPSSRAVDQAPEPD
jgi:hypothetical protein